jgi:hypothetical protein
VKRNIINSWYFFLLAFPVLLPTGLQSQSQLQYYHDKLVHKYGNINSISLKFKLRENKGFEGTMKAQKGNKFILEVPERTVV